METNYDEELKKLYEQLQEAIKQTDNVEDSDLENLINISYEDLEEEIINQQKKQTIKFKKLNEDAVVPKYAYELDSGFDLYSVEKFVVPPFGRVLIPTGLSFDLPELS